MERLLSVAALALIVAACTLTTNGSGTIAIEKRDISGFRSVEVSDGIALTLFVVEDGETDITVSYDDNLIDRVITRLDGDRLIVELDGFDDINEGNRYVEIDTPSLDSLSASGGATVKAYGLVATFAIDASGGANVDALSLFADTVDIEASGGSRVGATATVAASGDASGGAAIFVEGNPTTFDFDVSGGASAERVDN